METVQYKKYEDRLKIQCIINLLAKCFTLASVVMFVFIPFYRLRISAIFLENPEANLAVFSNASCFSMMKSVLTTMSKVDLSNMVASVFLTFQATFAFIIVFGFIRGIYELIKEISKIVNLNAYALQTYDEIKKGEDNDAKNLLRRSGAVSLFAPAIVLECVSVGFLGIEELSYNSDISDDILMSIAPSGINAWIIVPIIFIAATVTLSIISESIRKKVKLDILKEDYHVQDAAPVPASDK